MAEYFKDTSSAQAVFFRSEGDRHSTWIDDGSVPLWQPGPEEIPRTAEPFFDGPELGFKAKLDLVRERERKSQDGPSMLP